MNYKFIHPKELDSHIPPQLQTMSAVDLVSGLEDCPRNTVQISSPESQIKTFIRSRYESLFQTVESPSCK
jgi:hypothetical protein